MARGEGDSGLKSHFVERVVKLPMVHVAWDYATNTYSHIKESNKLVNFTLTNAEKSVTFVADQAKPVVLKFEKQIQAVDNLACIGLGTLEERVPFILKPAEEIIGDTRKLYASTVYSRLEGIKKLGNDTVKSAADFGLKQATAILGESLVHSILSTVDGALVVTQNYVDHVLPPTQAESTQNHVHEEDSEKESPLSRLTHITSVVRQRAYQSALLKIEYLQERSIDVFVIYPFQMIELTKTNMDAAVQFANRLWLSILEKKTDDTVERSRIQQQLLHMARMISGQVAAVYFSFINNTSSSNEDQEPRPNPAVINAVSERLLQVFGSLKSVREVLPMFIYGFVTGLEETKNPKQTENRDTVQENGSMPHENNHSNSVQQKHTDDINSSGHYSDSSIPEEDEDEL